MGGPSSLGHRARRLTERVRTGSDHQAAPSPPPASYTSASPPHLDWEHHFSGYWPSCWLSSTNSPVCCGSLSPHPCPGSWPLPLRSAVLDPPETSPTPKLPSTHPLTPLRAPRELDGGTGTAHLPQGSAAATARGIARLGLQLCLAGKRPVLAWTRRHGNPVRPWWGGSCCGRQMMMRQINSK